MKKPLWIIERSSPDGEGDFVLMIQDKHAYVEVARRHGNKGKWKRPNIYFGDNEIIPNWTEWGKKKWKKEKKRRLLKGETAMLRFELRAGNWEMMHR